ncbi:MAG: hypothetical protein HOQ45_20900 [Nocardioidaceae bacterium]|nr:hypothetical protein [Nocardioidaceae bacterium]
MSSTDTAVRHCVFPGCRTDAQSTPGSAAPLCRRHLDLARHHGWSCRRLGDGYLWSSPLGREQLVRV